MNRESLSNADWLRIVDRLGGAELFEAQAWELGAFHSLDRDEYPLSAISALYRLRWCIEIAFKHLKGGVGTVGPPGEDQRSAKAHIVCNLLLALLAEPLIADHLGDSPRRAAAEKPAFGACCA